MELMRVKHDSNGNPRYVVHFLELLSPEEQAAIDAAVRDNNKRNGHWSQSSIHVMFDAALKKSRKIGGSKYRGKDFGGGIVFQSYNAAELKRDIEHLSQPVEAVQA